MQELKYDPNSQYSEFADLRQMLTGVKPLLCFAGYYDFWLVTSPTALSSQGQMNP